MKTTKKQKTTESHLENDPSTKGSSMMPKSVYAVPLKQDEEIRFSLKEFKGNQYFDMRLFFKSQAQETMLPSKKGLTLGINTLDEVAKGIEALRAEVKAVSA